MYALYIFSSSYVPPEVHDNPYKIHLMQILLVNLLENSAL